jgi:hypothetical protein
MCEKAVVDALRSEGLSLIGRQIVREEGYIQALIKEPHWALLITHDSCDISSEKRMLIRLEEWDTRSPQEFTKLFVQRMRASVRKWKQGSV